MGRHRNFAIEQVFPSDWPNTLGEFISAGESNFRLIIKSGDATKLQVPAGTGNDQVAIGIAKVGDATAVRWRYVTATVERASIGGSARTLDVFVTGTDNSFTPGDPAETDSTDYSFALIIVEHNAAPSGVALARKIAEAAWSGTAFTALDVLVGPQSGASRHAATHATGGTDPVTPGSIGAATAADHNAEVSRATAAEGLLLAKADNLGALASASAARGNLGLGTAATHAATDFDAAGAATAAAAAATPDASTTVKGLTKMSVAPASAGSPIAAGDNDPRLAVAAAGTASIRKVGTGSTDVVAGNDGRLSDSRAPTAHASTHGPAGADPLSGLTVAQFAAATANLVPTDVVSSLPASPTDGQEVLLVGPAGGMWRMKYLGYKGGLYLNPSFGPAGSGWFCLGGVAAYLDQNSTADTMTAGAGYTTGAHGFAMTLAQKGVFDITVEANLTVGTPGSGVATGYVGYSTPSAAAVDSNSAQVSTAAGETPKTLSIGRTTRVGVSAGGDVAHQVKAVGAGVTVALRRLIVMPVQIGTP